jgi:hypothetical protein
VIIVKIRKDDNASGEIFGVLIVFAAIFIFGVFGAVILQNANDGYSINNSTTLGKTAETNDTIMSLVIQFWPAIAVLGFMLICAVIAGVAIKNGGSGHGRY